MSSRAIHLSILAAILGVLSFGAGAVRAVTPSDTVRASVSTSETEGFGASSGNPQISSNGRFVVFTTRARFGNLDSSGPDVYLRDLVNGFTEQISIGQPVVPGPFVRPNGDSSNGSVSADGKLVAFQSNATNLVTGDANNRSDIFVRNRTGGVTRVSTTATGGEVDGDSTNPMISADGDFVVFQSAATNLVGGDDNDLVDIFIKDLTSGAIRRVSTDRFGAQANGASSNAVISDDGGLVAFQSVATNLAGADTDANSDVYVKDVFGGNIRLVSVDSGFVKGDDDSTLPAMDSSGNMIAFVSVATNLDPNDTNGSSDVFVRDMNAQTTLRVSTDSNGIEGDDNSGASSGITGATAGRPAVSGDGRFVAYPSEATNLIFSDGNSSSDVFVYDTVEAITERASVGLGLIEGLGASAAPSLSGSGLQIAYLSSSNNFVSGDFNGSVDVFVTSFFPPTGGNQPPIADAGLDQSVEELDTVTLDASQSSDPDGDGLNFDWQQLFTGATGADLDDPIITLDDTTSPSPSFDAPLVDQFEDVVFRVTVTDGINAPQTATVLIEINAILGQTVSGSVVDGDGNPIIGAVLTLVRSDGAQGIEATTDQFGAYVIQNARVGDNVLTVTALGYEPYLEDVTVDPGVSPIVDIVLEIRTATIFGTILLADGQNLANATVLLLDGDGNVLGQDLTDSAGEYRIDNLTRSVVGQSALLQILRTPNDVPWINSNLNLIEGELNQRDFQYGNLRVTVAASSKKVARQLNGTVVEVLIGEQVFATNTVRNNVRTFSFPNVPSTLVRVRAYNRNKLTGRQVELDVRPGRGPSTVTLTMRPRGVF